MMRWGDEAAWWLQASFEVATLRHPAPGRCRRRDPANSLGAILSATPVLRGVLLTGPRFWNARDNLQKAGVTDRCESFPAVSSTRSLAGPMPTLKRFFTTGTTQARAILANVRRAMNGHGKLLIVERVPDRMERCAGHRFTAASDLLMMVAASGRERTEGEYRALLKSSAFLRRARLTPRTTP
jgi:hypothetical protein